MILCSSSNNNIRDQSSIRERGRGVENGRGWVSQTCQSFTPIKRAGAENVLAMLKGVSKMI